MNRYRSNQIAILVGVNVPNAVSPRSRFSVSESLKTPLLIQQRMWRLKVSYLIAIMLSVSGSALAQPSSKVTQGYQYLNQAELALCRFKNAEALQSYVLAYQCLGNKMSSRSLYNYFLASVYGAENATSKILLKELKRRGWKKAEFEKIYQHFPAEKVAMLAKLYDKVKVVPTTDKNYTGIVDSVAARDQTCNLYFRGLNNGLLIGEGFDSLSRLTDNNIKYFAGLFSTRFPSDSLIGTYYDIPYGECRYWIILRHNTQFNNLHDLDPILQKAMEDGHLEPSDLAYWMSYYYIEKGRDSTIQVGENSYGVPFRYDEFQVVHDSLFLLPSKAERTYRFNEQRKKIPGLCTIEEMREKTIFQYYNKQYHLLQVDILELEFELPSRLRKALVYCPKPVAKGS